MQDLQRGLGRESAQPGKLRGRQNEDILKQILALQRMSNARNFAIFRVSGTGISTKRKIITIADNFPPERDGPTAILDAYGDLLTAHIESSMLPLMWNGRDDNSTAETVDFDHFVVRLRGRVLPYSGVAFPVKLGVSGNGYAVFSANYLDLASEMMLKMHLQATAILASLLQQEQRREQPAEMLTEREIACLQMAGDGRISEEIAETLGLSVHTVNAYLGTATTKLDSVNRIQAIAKAIRLGYIN
jgi:DNA-binding CsgD family transcriptional regulator